MSETVTIGGSYTATIYGTFAGAINHLQTKFGDRYKAFLAVPPDDQKRALVSSAALLDRQGWLDAYNTFALRDAFLAPDTRPVFQLASYELAALIVEDDSITNATDQGSNVQSLQASGAGLTFFNPTSAKQGSAPRLPPILMDLVGSYLSASLVDGPNGGSGQSGSSTNPFSQCSELDRRGPW